MKYNRQEVIEALIDDKVETVTQWAIQDLDSLTEYVTEAEGLDRLDDDTLKNLWESAFGDEIED